MFEELMKCEYDLVTVKVISSGSHTQLPILGKRETGDALILSARLANVHNNKFVMLCRFK